MDGYRNSDQPPLHEYSTDQRYPSHYNITDSYKPKSRESSRDRSDISVPEYRAKYSQHQQPINEAVSTAFDKADPANPLNPELIAQITENVIKQLRTSTIDNMTPVPSHPQYPPPPTHQPVPISPSTQSGASPPMLPRNVYTPPSPHKHSDYPAYGSPDSQSASYARPPSPREPPNSQFEDKRPLSRVSQSSDPSNVRPRGPTRLSTSKEETTLEKIWGQLFDEESHPTVRLGQFLRGLAVHLIEDYEPHHSLVITPNKMIKYYEDVRLSNELYPWSDVFDDEHSSISRLFRDLECQHHLVQERHDRRPDIPGLTPVGFERWATLMIQAHPDVEFERLQKAVLEMPISNPDDKKERFPKELSRRLFPYSEDRRVRDRLEKAIVEHAGVILPKRSSSPDVPKNSQPEATLRRTETLDSESSSYVPSNIERERKPYSTIPNESAIDDTNPPVQPQPQPIERERKPYRAGPGGGKLYEEEGRPNPPSHPVRSNSTASATRPIPVGGYKAPGDFPPPEIHNRAHRLSTSQRRRQSPSGNDFRRSDGDLRTFTPSVYQSSNVPPTAEAYEEDSRRHTREAESRRAEYVRRQADDDVSKYGGSPSRTRTYDSRIDADPRRSNYANEEDYYRAAGRPQGNGYDYSQSYR